MKAKKINNFYIIRIEQGEEVLKTLKEFCDKNNIKSGYLSGIGACGQAEIALYSLEEKKYYDKKVSGDYEIISLSGTISDENIHLHIALGDHNFNMLGGHLKSALISVTCEIMLIPGESPLSRIPDEKTGLRLLNI